MILIIDFGSQTCHLIGRRIRQIGSNAIIVTPDMASAEIKRLKPKGIILSGGPSSVYAKDAPQVDDEIFNMGIPILGICYGQQLTAHLLPGGKTVKDKIREDGPATLIIDKSSTILEGFSPHSRIWMSHGDTVIRAPDGFEFVAHSQTIKSASMVNEQKKIYGVQFHPEVDHTEDGMLVLRNFVEKICNIKTSEKTIDVNSIISTVKQQIGDKQALAAVSGGVDSTVAAALVGRAIGNKLTVVFADNGLMRVGAREEVEHIFREMLNINLIVIDCKELFLKKLKGVIDPEQKRKIIGSLYIELFQIEAKKLQNIDFLVQGTIYSDVIESQGSKHAAKIKSHHNVGGLPENMKFKLVEPLRDFYKDEVREIGRNLGLSEDSINKQPFPGPGQAIRIIGEVTAERLARQQHADQIVLQEIKKAGIYDKIFQSFPILTGANSTAVKGDGRFYGEVVALRIYDSSDIMSASWSRLPYELLQSLASRITNEVKGVSRVVYDITTKPPATMEWE